MNEGEYRDYTVENGEKTEGKPEGHEHSGGRDLAHVEIEYLDKKERFHS